MVRKIFLILGVSILLLGCAKNVANINSQGKTIVCFGDSLTAGTGASIGRDYPSILSGILKEPIINAGSQGDTTSDALERLERDVLEKDPYLVIIGLGGNDYLKKITFTDTARSLEEIIQKIRDKGAVIVIADTSVSFMMGDYKALFKRLAKQYKAVYVANLLTDIFSQPEYKYDYIHPNEKGYRVIAQRLSKVIIPIIEENKRRRK